MDSTERVSLRLSEFPRSWLNSNMACASCRADAIEVDVTILEQPHNRGIKPRAGSFFDLAHGLVQRYGWPVLAIGGEGVEAIDHGQNSSADWNLCSRKTRGISRPIPPFVVRAYDGRHRVREGNAIENFGAHQGMNFHLLELLRSKPARLVDNVLRN